ncbi:MAG TPA: SAM-dependent methyltransferase, partial [bacterium]|nr:SAM-dependent methyltransferase [bacterium]
MSQLGTFYGVGIGPGDPELLTQQARRILGGVPVIFIPKAKITDEGLALQILLNSVVNKTGAELKDLVFPMSKDPAVLKPAWAVAREAVLETLRQGKDAALITLGDTAIYSTYMNMVAELR